MTVEEQYRRASDWDRQEERVLQALQDLRLSSDSALKAVNELKEQFITYKAATTAHMDSQDKEIAELKSRLDNANKWLMGILAAIIVFGFQQLLPILQHAPGK